MVVLWVGVIAFFLFGIVCFYTYDQLEYTNFLLTRLVFWKNTVFTLVGGSVVVNVTATIIERNIDSSVREVLVIVFVVLSAFFAFLAFRWLLDYSRSSLNLTEAGRRIQHLFLFSGAFLVFIVLGVMSTEPFWQQPEPLPECSQAAIPIYCEPSRLGIEELLSDLVVQLVIMGMTSGLSFCLSLLIPSWNKQRRTA